jgi:hypothetical protein
MSEAHGRPFKSQFEEIEDRLEVIEGQLGQLKTLRIIEGQVKAILVLLEPQQPVGVLIIQTDQGGNTMAVTGIQAGGAAGVFESDPIPSTIPFPPGTVDTWTSDDPTVVLTPSATNPAQVSAQTPATNVNKAFNLTVSTQMPAVGGVTPAALTATVNVPIIPAPAPLPTGVSINQVS